MRFTSSAEFKANLLSVPTRDRDAWVDRELGFESIPQDGPELPRGCVPYLPCSVDAILQFIEFAQVCETDIVVDIGSGVGRALTLVHLLTGASVIGIEVQSDLVRAARDLAARLNLSCVTTIQGDAAQLQLPEGSVFFLYCPFGPERVERVLDRLEIIAQHQTIRIGCVDMPEMQRAWLKAVGDSGPVSVYRSVTRSG